MIVMRLHCGACGGTWEVYTRQRDSKTARICPHCEHKINRDTWEDKILPAFQAAGAANLALVSDSVNNHTGDFEVDFIADGRFPNAGLSDLKQQLFVIQNAIKYMQEQLCDE